MYKSYNQQYQDMLREIMENGYEEVNQRTGHKVKSIPGMTLEVDGEFPLLSLRKVPIRIFVAEQIWFISGSRRPDEFLQQFTKIWDDFSNPNGVVSAAYGYRWRHHFKRDQLDKLITLLEDDQSSRHGVISMWDPATDGLEAKALRKNVPCPFIFVVNIIGGRLNLHLVVRSNDMILGFPHDVGGFALLQRFLAARLDVEVGKFTQSISHAHIYDIHYDAAWEMIERKTPEEKIEISLRKDAFKRAENQDVDLVKEIVDELKGQYKPLDKIKGLKIVL